MAGSDIAERQAASVSPSMPAAIWTPVVR